MLLSLTFVGMMIFMEGQGVGGHVGDESSPSLCFFSRWFQNVSTQCDSRALL